MMENPIRMDDLGVPLFLETSIYEPFAKFLGHPSHQKTKPPLSIKTGEAVGPHQAAMATSCGALFT